MYRPHVAILLICVSHKTRRVDFRRLTGSQRIPRVWGVTITKWSIWKIKVYATEKDEKNLRKNKEFNTFKTSC